MVSVADSPFAVLTAVVAPAVLTNASSVLCLGTSNRLARVVDRTRVIIADLKRLPDDSPEYREHLRQIERLKIRGRFLILALRMMYAALGGFVASALASVLGAVSLYYARHILFAGFAIFALVVGLFATVGIVGGCTLMVRETTLAIRSVGEEVEVVFGELKVAGKSTGA
ncbi:MAG TPA: DUF2721 domain-containing protein [Terriglobales bacterium]|nr:DUF2721 domain-containing protein [Terriglobales bacterium]